jgi:DNA-binding MarR family transcriptional regulator
MDAEELENLDQLWHEVQRAVRTEVGRALREAMPAAPGGRAFGIISLLRRHGPLSPSDLAHRTDVRTSTMTAHLDRLEELGWVRRDRIPGGGARVEVKMTPAGEEAFTRYLEIRRLVFLRFLDPLESDERIRLARTLDRVATAHRARREQLDATPGGAKEE